MSVTSDRTVSLQIIIKKPKAGICYGLQKGSGSTCVTEQAQMSGDSDLTFELVMPVKADRAGRFVFSGPFAQGSPEERFVYIGMGSYAGQKDSTINGRLKIPLPELSGNLLVYMERGSVLAACVPGTDPKTGQPKMATAEPEDGWIIAS
ncbi:DUF5990 family protein [Flaviaesturariibacter aridisoli]|uniref:DUF5990 family protein n=1 Tax=Flaviaesturariibacter aridisoli TaxID=2545761 RepID=UPI003743B077